jgi:hypothetical protein
MNDSHFWVFRRSNFVVKLKTAVKVNLSKTSPTHDYCILYSVEQDLFSLFIANLGIQSLFGVFFGFDIYALPKNPLMGDSLDKASDEQVTS